MSNPNSSECILKFITSKILFSVCALLLFSLGCGGSSDDASVFEITFENISSSPSFRAEDGSQVVTVFSSMVGIVHEGSNVFSQVGAPDQGRGLANLAENGDISILNQTLRIDPSVEIIGIADEPSSGSIGIVAPGQSLKLILSTIIPNSRLSIALSFLQANDIVVMTNPEGIPLFDITSGAPKTGDITSFFSFYDVGTEVNQAPGIGSNQVIRQSEAPEGQISAGARENGVVRQIDDGFSYPSISQSIRVTINSIQAGNINATPTAQPTTTPSISESPTPSSSSAPAASITATQAVSPVISSSPLASPSPSAS